MTVKGTIKRLLGLMGLEIRRTPKVFRPEPAEACDPSRGAVEVATFAWAKANQSFDFIDRGLYDRWDLDADNYGLPEEIQEKHKWGLKGFGYSLVVETARKLHSGGKERLNILDVGGGGSALCRVLCEEFPDRGWIVDDFGIESRDGDTAGWYRQNLRESLRAKNPNVTYVFGRLGEERIVGLMDGSFDFVFSVSTLEHVPMKSMGSVFDHMLALLAPDGCMVHTIDTTKRRLAEWQIFLADYFKQYGVPPTTFATKNLDEVDEQDPPLLESAEVQYVLHHQRRYHQEGTLVLEVYRRDGSVRFG
jgi:hypothetical protein